MLGRLSGMLGRRRRIVIAAWALLVLAALPLAARQSDHLTGGGQSVPGSGSARVDRASAAFPGQRSNQMAVVVAGARSPRVRAAALRRLRAAVAEQGQARLLPRPAAQRLRDRDGGPVLFPLQTPTRFSDGMDVARGLYDKLHVGGRDPSGARFYLVGSPPLWTGLSETSKQDLVVAEAIGFPVVLLVLLAVFGSLVAAVLPVGLGVGSVAVTGALIWLLSRSLEMSVFVTNVASLIGIGVAVDYSLFILVRYREAIRAGVSPEEAGATALRTSGAAVIVSGTTVIAALSGLFLLRPVMVRSMAIGGIVVVAVSVLVAVTLLPAVLAAAGDRVLRPGRLVSRLRRRRPGNGWDRWTRRVMRRPVVSAAVATALMLVACAPALWMHVGNGALEQLHGRTPTTEGLALAQRRAGPGVGSEIEVLVEARDGAVLDVRQRRLVADLRRRLAAQPAVARVGPPAIARDGRSALVTAVPTAHFESPPVIALAKRLERDPASLAPALARSARISVGGGSAQDTDFSDSIERNLWKIFVWAVALVFVLLVLMLRSVVLPLKAVVMNLLTVGAAYGVVVAVFQWGWLDWTGVFRSPGHVTAFSLAYVLAIVFGLSMDYEVFLLARVRERYMETGDNRLAVADALRTSAGTITSAAAIMVGVYLIFAFVSVTSVQEIGLGLAVAIALDATLVRLVLVPASMQLLGRWNWWLPGWLDRLLPGGARPETPAPRGAEPVALR